MEISKENIKRLYLYSGMYSPNALLMERKDGAWWLFPHPRSKMKMAEMSQYHINLESSDWHRVKTPIEIRNSNTVKSFGLIIK